MKKNKAFSLLECVISLVVICSLVIAGSVYLQELKSKIIFDKSIALFKKNLEQAGRYAVINAANMRVTYYPSAHELNIMGPGYFRRVTFDSGIRISLISKYYISENGICAPKTITFSDGKHRQQIRLQMAWGKVIDAD